LEVEAKVLIASFDSAIGMVFLNIIESVEPDDFAAMAKELGFPIKDIPTAAKKAEAHFTKSIDVTKEIGAKYILAEAYLFLGLLHKAEKRTGEARKNISRAIHIFEKIGAEGYFKQAKDALASLG
jgi:tetratricopeptide (TPR) repeat protein